MVSGHSSRVTHEIISGHRDGMFPSAVEGLFLKHKVFLVVLELLMTLVQDTMINIKNTNENVIEYGIYKKYICKETLIMILI